MASYNQQIEDAYFEYTYARDALSEESTVHDRNEVTRALVYYLGLKKQVDAALVKPPTTTN
eukprot:4490691-Pyramimonas_sp.AAC.1